MKFNFNLNEWKWFKLHKVYMKMLDENLIKLIEYESKNDHSIRYLDQFLFYHS